ncbi:MAG: ATP-binding protein [Gammaproteobacteria bacterium]|nr:ATP-binding protein [Gammaproteobacteria bacterium]
MQKIFNTTGPCFPEEYYMLPAQARCRDLMDLIEQEHYFVIHAARQSGKTTLLLDLARQLNDSGEYYALYCSLESVQKIDDAERGIPAIIGELSSQIRFHRKLRQFAFKVETYPVTVALREALSWFCDSLDKPLVILFDEVDCLANGTLVAFLRQLRNGYVNRGQIPFVHSAALVGMRNIRDYKADVRDGQKTMGSASPFNIVAETMTLRNFTLEETAELYAQHTAAAGQMFSPEVIAGLYGYTQGQPWLVSAAAREITGKILEGDFSRGIVPEHVAQAVETIIKRRDMHIDSLLKRLKETRVQRIVEPVILGQSSGYEWEDDDYQYTLDLGLLREAEGKLIPANPIYGEVIMRALSSSSQMELSRRNFPAPAYLAGGKLDMRRLLEDFQEFWRINSESWIERYQYKEAAPHLILHAFLYRIINGGGRITREIAAGNGRLDLCLHYRGKRYPVELKLRYTDKTYAEGRDQLNDYMDRLGCAEGWLVVFDRRVSVTWEKKIFWQSHDEQGKLIHVAGC